MHWRLAGIVPASLGQEFIPFQNTSSTRFRRSTRISPEILSRHIRLFLSCRRWNMKGFLSNNIIADESLLLPASDKTICERFARHSPKTNDFLCRQKHIPKCSFKPRNRWCASSSPRAALNFSTSTEICLEFRAEVH